MDPDPVLIWTIYGFLDTTRLKIENFRFSGNFEGLLQFCENNKKNQITNTSFASWAGRPKKLFLPNFNPKLLIDCLLAEI